MSRTVEPDGSTMWEFPVTFRGSSGVAAVFQQRGSAFLDVAVSTVDGECLAKLTPASPSRGTLADAYIVAVPDADGQRAVQARVEAKESVLSASNGAERVRLLESDSNWTVSDIANQRHVEHTSADDAAKVVSDADLANMLLATKAVRLHALLTVVRDSMRARAELASVAGMDSQSRVAYERADREMAQMLQHSSLPLETMTV